MLNQVPPLPLKSTISQHGIRLLGVTVEMHLGSNSILGDATVSRSYGLRYGKNIVE